MTSAGSVNSRRRSALQDLDVRDVIGIQIRCTIRRRGARQKALGRVRGVVDRGSIDDDQGLARPTDRLGAPDADEGRRAWLPGLADDFDVWGLPGERLDHVLLVTARDLRRVHVVADVPELLRRGDGPGAGDDDLADLQRVGDQGEVLGDRARPQRDLRGLRLITEHPGGDRDPLPRHARGGDHDRVHAVVPRDDPGVQLRDPDVHVRQRHAVLVPDATGNARGLLLLGDHHGGQERERADGENEPTKCTYHVPSL